MVITSTDLRDQYIARVVAGKTFAEVGGLWGTVNEKVSVAHQSGAASLAMIDITTLDGSGAELWHKFQHRMSEFGIQDYQCISRDVCDFYQADVQQFDVVHCSGVLYHHPNPLLQLQALRKLTRQYLVLTSAITQEVIQNDRGHYQLPPSGVLFVPALDDRELAINKQYWEAVGAVALGLTERCHYNVDDFGPWWWLPTPSALVSMCESVGFKVLDLDLTWSNNALTLLLEVVSSSDRPTSSGQSDQREPAVQARMEDIRSRVGAKSEIQSQVVPLALETEVSQLRAELEQARATIAKLKRHKTSTQELKKAKNTIKAMESSKFWKLRTSWVRLKKLLGLSSES